MSRISKQGLSLMSHGHIPGASAGAVGSEAGVALTAGSGSGIFLVTSSRLFGLGSLVGVRGLAGGVGVAPLASSL